MKRDIHEDINKNSKFQLKRLYIFENKQYDVCVSIILTDYKKEYLERNYML